MGKKPGEMTAVNVKENDDLVYLSEAPCPIST